MPVGLLQALFRRLQERRSIVTEADLMVQRQLTAALAKDYPSVSMLGEEISAEQQHAVLAGDDDFWCLDPIDGTTNFHATMPLFSVSLGLIRGGEVVLAIVYDPNRREFFGALRGQGLWLNGARLERPKQPRRLGDCIAFVDFKRLHPRLSGKLAQQQPYKSQRNIGTCALNGRGWPRGALTCLVHGSERIWDYAAGVLLNQEAGGYCQTFDGEPVYKPTLEPRSVIAASNEELFSAWKSIIQDGD